MIKLIINYLECIPILQPNDPFYIAMDFLNLLIILWNLFFITFDISF